MDLKTHLIDYSYFWSSIDMNIWQNAGYAQGTVEMAWWFRARPDAAEDLSFFPASILGSFQLLEGTCTRVPTPPHLHIRIIKKN